MQATASPSTKERLYRGAILIDWAAIEPTVINRIRAYRAIHYELVDLELAMVDEQIAEILERSAFEGSN